MNEGGQRRPRLDVAVLASHFGLRRILKVRPLSDADLGSHLLETGRGRFALRPEPQRSELELKREADFQNFLQRQGFPAYPPLADRAGRFWIDWEGAKFTLHRLPGRELGKFDPSRREHLTALGQCLALFHTTARAYRRGSELRYAPERSWQLYAQLREQMPPYHKRVQRLLDDEMRYLSDALDPKLPRGPIVGELGPRRFRLRQERVQLVLGCEPHARGPFLLDLANAVNLFCYADGRFHLPPFEAIVAPYDRTRALSLAEWDAFPNLLRFSAFRYAALSLRKFVESGREAALEHEFENWIDRLTVLRRERDGGLDPLLRTMAIGYDYRRYQRARSEERRPPHGAVGS